MKRASLRVVALDVPVQDVITRDNISAKVSAVLYFRVADPMLAIIEIQDYLYATGQLAQTTLLSVLGQVELDELLQARQKRFRKSASSRKRCVRESKSPGLGSGRSCCR